MSEEVWIERMKGRTLSVNVRLFTDKIAAGGEGYVKPRHAWFKGDVGFRPNEAHGLRSIGTEPIMFNRPEDLVAAIPSTSSSGRSSASSTSTERPSPTTACSGSRRSGGGRTRATPVCT